MCRCETQIRQKWLNPIDSPSPGAPAGAPSGAPVGAPSGNQPENPQPSTNTGNNIPVSTFGRGWQLKNRIYTVDGFNTEDSRGYIDPTTEKPYSTCQPHASNLSRALRHWQDSPFSPGFNSNGNKPFYKKVNYFYEEYVTYNNTKGNRVKIMSISDAVKSLRKEK